MPADSTVVQIESAEPKFYTVERNVPQPVRTPSVALTATLRKLQVGDSTVVPVQLRDRTYNYATRLGIRVMCRSLPARRGVRVWRIK